MLMTLIQKEVMHHILSVRFVRAFTDVCVAYSTYAFYRLSKLSTEPC